MADADLGTVEGPGRKRESWSLKTIVENVAGRPISEFQDPERPVHPYLAVKLGHLPPTERPRPRVPRAADDGVEGETDPIERVYPPLIGATGRALHGPEHEHHAGTLGSLAAGAASGEPGVRPHLPGPSRRPERIYLHFLLLHMDRLSDHALRYLKHAVDEELTHRERPGGGSIPPPGA
ncbi:MAG TPA: hypothetical protein VFG07_10650 [Thermoplasmata archaeon]|nr:hypothetical protein [Thermoplasmata archaeon]